MSDSERKKRSQCIDVWEEAGSEFYQESYPGMEADLEAFQKNPNKLSTLLPSNKTRTARKKINNGSAMCYQATATLKPYGTMCQNTMGLNNEIQISLMPDLSENLSNEELVWEEIMKIKTMPISMAHKKALKTKLKSADAFRLQGVQRMKWQTRKTRVYLKTKWTEWGDKFHLWNSSLRRVESHCGAGVVELFLLIKLLIALNAVAAIAVLVFVTLPAVYWTEWGGGRNASAAELWTRCETSNESASIECCSAIYANATGTAGPRLSVRGVADVIRGAGWVDGTPAYYGYYADDARFAVGRLFEYRVPAAYAATIACCFAVALLVVARRSAAGLRQRMVETQVPRYVHSNAVFAGWDCCISDGPSAALRRRAVRDELRELAAAGWPRASRSEDGGGGGRTAAVAAVRLCVWALIVAITGAACVSVRLIFDRAAELLRRDQSLAWAFALEFAAPAAVTAYNVALPVAFDALARFERRDARQRTRLRAVRIACVKASLLAALVGSVYRLVGCARERSQCSSAACSSPLCWETYAGQTAYRLLATDVACEIGVTLLIGCPRSVLARRLRGDSLRAACEPEPNLAKHVLDVIYVQAIVWLGSFYATAMPVLGLIALTVMFYVKRFACVVNGGLARRAHGSSDTRAAVAAALLASCALCTAAWLTAAHRVAPSRSCGPFRGLPSAWTVLADAARAVPPWAVAACRAATGAPFAWSLAVTLLCTVCYYRVAAWCNRKMIAVLRRQLVLEGHDKQFLLNRLSAFIKQREGRRMAAQNGSGDADAPPPS